MCGKISPPPPPPLPLVPFPQCNCGSVIALSNHGSGSGSPWQRPSGRERSSAYHYVNECQAFLQLCTELLARIDPKWSSYCQINITPNWSGIVNRLNMRCLPIYYVNDPYLLCYWIVRLFFCSDHGELMKWLKNEVCSSTNEAVMLLH